MAQKAFDKSQLTKQLGATVLNQQKLRCLKNSSCGIHVHLASDSSENHTSLLNLPIKVIKEKDEVIWL